MFLGILKKDWIHKHQNLLPAVLVLFVDLNWNEAALEEKTRACAQDRPPTRMISPKYVPYLPTLSYSIVLPSSGPSFAGNMYLL